MIILSLFPSIRSCVFLLLLSLGRFQGASPLRNCSPDLLCDSLTPLLHGSNVISNHHFCPLRNSTSHILALFFSLPYLILPYNCTFQYCFVVQMNKCNELGLFLDLGVEATGLSEATFSLVWVCLSTPNWAPKYKIAGTVFKYLHVHHFLPHVTLEKMCPIFFIYNI